MKFKFRKRLYISAELRNIILSNLGIGGISFVLDVYGIINLSVEFALLGAIVGGLDMIFNLYLIRRYMKKSGNRV